jgi:hypothetical protein
MQAYQTCTELLRMSCRHMPQSVPEASFFHVILAKKETYPGQRESISACIYIY